MAETETLSAKQVAIQLGVDAKALRKFLRSNKSPIEAVGQGNRYEFTSKDVAKLRKFFTHASGEVAATNGTKSKPKAEPKTKKTKPAKVEPKKPRSMMTDAERTAHDEAKAAEEARIPTEVLDVISDTLDEVNELELEIEDEVDEDEENIEPES